MTHHAQRWDARYARSTVWSGQPNEALLRWLDAFERSVGTALDLGCGEGADALHLASRGWQTTAVDFSEVAIARGRAQPEGHAVTWEVCDLAQWVPSSQFDLVSLCFFHEEPPVREQVWRAAASALAPRGTLLIVAHAPSEAAHLPGPPAERRYDATQVLAALGEGWQVAAGEVARAGANPRIDLVMEMTKR